MEESTISAISTPIGVGGISIVRTSGTKSLQIALSLFRSKNLDSTLIEPRKFYLGKFNCGDFEEKCMLVYFRAPNSYTGEDIVEIQCHGGELITKLILQQLLKKGCSLADAGEFTKRAFLNGKVSLDEAEGVIDVINSESESEIRAGYNLINGNLFKEVNELQNYLTDTLAKAEVTLDYPEEDLEEQTTKDLLSVLKKVQANIAKILDTSSTGKLIKQGTRILIYGKTNVGKSSLLNAMLNYDRAIVTDIQGTTRDTIEETYIYNGVKFILIDTAGIRESKNEIESIGINRAKNCIKESDIVLFVVDGSTKIDNELIELYKSVCDKKHILVVNKCDKVQNININAFNKTQNVVEISALNKTGIEKLKQMIYSVVIDDKIINNNIIITNLRHVDALNRANKYIESAINGLEENQTLDVVCLDVKNVWSSLGEITGTTNNEEIINTIFDKFCVGK